MAVAGFITAGTAWKPSGPDRLTAVLADGRVATVWRTGDGAVAFSAGKLGGWTVGASLLEQCARLAREARDNPQPKGGFVPRRMAR